MDDTTLQPTQLIGSQLCNTVEISFIVCELEIKSRKNHRIYLYKMKHVNPITTID